MCRLRILEVQRVSAARYRDDLVHLEAHGVARWQAVIGQMGLPHNAQGAPIDFHLARIALRRAPFA